MVRVLCLEDDEPDEPDVQSNPNGRVSRHDDGEVGDGADPNLHHGLSAALSCYP